MNKNVVYIKDCKDYSQASGSVFELLDELGVNPSGKRVLVKPNILGPYGPSRNITTRPEIVEATISWLEERGAISVVVGDNPGLGGYGGNLASAVGSGIKAVVGDRFVNLAERSTIVNIPSLPGFPIPISSEILEADLIVNIPKLKTHTLTVITGAIKNTFGYVVGGAKSKIHAAAPTPDKFARACLDIYEQRPPEINLMDGIIGMEGNGPSGDDLRRPERLLASRNAVALDIVMCRIMGIKPSAIPIIRIATEAGLCPQFEGITIEGNATPVKGFKTPSSFISSGLMNWLVNRLGFSGLTPVPYIDTDLCIECGRCEEACPTEALNDFPQISDEHCITCYCCQEMCVDNAVKLRGYWGEFMRSQANKRASRKSEKAK